jgi:hypothetical protein
MVTSAGAKSSGGGGGGDIDGVDLDLVEALATKLHRQCVALIDQSDGWVG